MKKKILSVIALLLAAVLLLGSCASHGKTLLEAGDNEISVNVFQLYLSRMKYSLQLAGEDISKDEYWSTYINTDNVTQAQYYTDQVFQGLRQIAAALILYDELGLKLSGEDEDKVDDLLEQMIEEVGDGSKSRFNSVLAAYGANLTVLRDAYIIEAKMAQLKAHLYGESGSLIASTAKEEFYDGLYYRGKQMLIGNTYHDHEKDAHGLTVYYKTDAEGNLTNEIAYDTVNGTPMQEEGKTVYREFGDVAYDTKNGKPSDDRKRDDRGDLIYYLENGRIAYDTEKGMATDKTDENGDTVYRLWVIAYDDKSEKASPKYFYDSKGNNKIAYYTDEEMEQRLLVAQKIAEDCSGSENGEALFDEYAKEYSDSLSFDKTFAPNGMYFATGSAMSDRLFGSMAVELSKIKDGELVVMESDAGYYLLMRCKLDDGAWSKEENKAWFESFNELLIEHMLQKRLTQDGYVDRVTVNEDIKKSVDITMVAANAYY